MTFRGGYFRIVGKKAFALIERFIEAAKGAKKNLCDS